MDGCRAAVDLVCVVDTSGSMSSDATVQDTAGHTESYGITVLDIVKHAVRSVAGMLGPNDRLAVVAFSSTARVVMPFTAMSVVGKETVTRVLGGLEPRGGTNLWDGQYVAMELARTAVNNTAILLLTDGCPTDHPPRGHIPTMTSYYDALGAKRSFSVHTFGFGYSLQSDLLNSIAEKSSGLFVFIPDAGLVGTVFINTVSSLLATVSPQVHLEIEVSNPSVWDIPLALTAPNVLTADVGALQFGQPRTFYVKAATSDMIVVRASAKIGEVVHTLTARLAEKTSETVIAPFRFRSMFNSRLTAVLSHDRGPSDGRHHAADPGDGCRDQRQSSVPRPSRRPHRAGEHRPREGRALYKVGSPLHPVPRAGQRLRAVQQFQRQKRGGVRRGVLSETA